MALMAALLIAWFCAKRRRTLKDAHRDTGSLRSFDQEKFDIQAISRPVLKSSSHDALTKQPLSRQTSFAPSTNSDDSQQLRRVPGVSTNSTFANDSNVDASFLPQSPNSPGVSLQRSDSSDTKKSIPRVPPPPVPAVPPQAARLFSAPKLTPTEAVNSLIHNPRHSTAPSDCTLGGGSVEHIMGRAVSCDVNQPTSGGDNADPADSRPASAGSERFSMMRLPPIPSVVSPFAVEEREVLRSPATPKRQDKHRSATLTWLKGPWN